MGSTVNSSNNSDYNLPYTDLYNLLPQPYQSTTNRSVMSNLFNRFLSPSETTEVIGYVGDGNHSAVFPQKIVEPTVHRAGWQLQPILYSKIGSIEYITSWYDILDELTAQGINIDNQQEWLNATVFNWIPPIDINKIVNYQDYYWYDTTTPNSQPQYVTVKSVCAQATALVTYMQNLITQFGATFNIVRVLPSVNGIQVLGDQTQLFDPGFVFYITGSNNSQLNNSFQTVSSSSYNSAQNTTTIVVENTITNNTAGGQITLNEQLQTYQNLQSCECSNASGWDTQPWDDNQPNQPPPIWNAAVLADISYPTLAMWNAAHPSPELNDIWYDTTNDILWQLTNVGGATNISNWFEVYANFSLILQQSTGTAYWDLSTGCAGSAATIAGLNQWISTNKWVHKTDVANFSIAKRAQAPIIEFEPQLELNEWNYTTYSWSYRSSTLAGTPFNPVASQPTRFELEPIYLYTVGETNVARDTFILDERFGNLTDVFVPGYSFLVAGYPLPFTVSQSYYFQAASNNAFNTYVVVNEAPIPAFNPTINNNYLHPEKTSLGDAFKGYGQQWLFNGVADTVAINHQAENQWDDPSEAPAITDPSGNFSYQLAPYAEQFNMLVDGITTLTLSTTPIAGSSRTLQQRALVGFNDIRVYINGVRQYGNYDENADNTNTWVVGVTFLSPLSLSDTVVICVGEAAYSDFGNYAVAVRMVADDTQYASSGNTLGSLIQMRKAEQVKTAVNQYPLFDIYFTNSSSANIANEIFAYHQDPSGVLYPYLGQRVVTNSDGSLEFVNELVQTNNGAMYAYRNYNDADFLYWFNSGTQQLLVWTGQTWSQKYIADGYFSTPLVLSALPDAQTTSLGTLVFNTTNNTLYQRTNTPNNWTVETSVTISASDPTLQTVWRDGTNDEQAIPQRQDWFRRSYPEYQTEYNAFLTTTEQQLLQQNPSLTQEEAEVQANDLWTQQQQRWINNAWYSVPGTQRQGPLWCGQWQIPDPLYYNVMHWNYQFISQIDLNAHFQSVVAAQPLFPGFTGSPSANWNLIAYQNIDWGLGGTIHEYDNSFDTFLSSQYTNVVTPSTLFGFAQSEYENIIVTLGQTFQHNAVNLLTKVDTTTILTPQVPIANYVITQYEENEAANLIYGDSTTYTQGTLTTPSKGVQNWIATLPYFGIVPAIVPCLDYDPSRGIIGVVHHDGHRNTYSIPLMTINSLQTQIANTVDPRSTLLPPEKIGRISKNQPPATQALFQSEFSTFLRTGVYWLQSTTNTLYRMTAFVQNTVPITTYANQTFWWNTNTGSITVNGTTYVPESLYTLESGQWVLFSANNISAGWQKIDLSELYAEIVLEAETMLYQNLPPTPTTPPVNFAALEAKNPSLWNSMLQQQFNNYVRTAQITSPYANNTFDMTNPFTWNYKYSTTTQEPRSGTIPSGGCWQDVYQKTYFTPYPHLEPWVLQGYTSKPTWWDETFVNDNEQLYGTRRWKYLHSLTITSVPAANQIAIGPFGNNLILDAFRAFDQFTVYNSTGQFTYTIQNAQYVGGYTIVTTTTNLDSSIVANNTVAVGMWDYVVRGATPNKQQPPLTPQTWAYLSVNITGQSFVDGNLTYNPDDVFPPYWNVAAHTPPLGTYSQDKYVRSIFTDTTTEVVSENADYQFGDSGPIEWAWRDSTYYLYALLTMAYYVQPVRTIQSTFGIDFEYVNDLPIDALTGQVFSHQNTNFHGEINVNNVLVKVNGTNQWYINYLRANGYDTSYSDFRAMWTTWTAPLTHQFDATIDTSSFQINHRQIVISNADYELTMKKSPAVSNSWVDAFNVQIQSIPPVQGLFDPQAQWVLNVDSLAPITRTISYYDVQLYDFYVNPSTNVCSLYTYPIVAASNVENTFTVDGDVSNVFGVVGGASQFSVTGSTGNNGTYTVTSATYDAVLQQTTLTVTASISTSLAGGLITALNYRTLPYSTGQLVAIATTEIAPLPLDVTKQYFIIVLSPTTFKLALTNTDAVANIPIEFTSQAFGIQKIGTLYSTFQALNGQNVQTVWTHYAIDKTNIKQFTTPYQIIGMQNWVNILDGYAAYITAQGFGVNVDGSYVDPQTGQQVSWQNEIERFLNWAYTQRSVRRQRINDKYAVAVNYQTSQLTYTSQTPNFAPGSPVVVWGFGGGLPPPLVNGQQYYVFNNNNGSVSLASSRTNALANLPIVLQFSGTTGQLYLSAASLYLAELPTYEINPFRNALWYAPPDGIVSNVVTGPFADITTEQLLFDQYGRKLTPGDIRVFRQDKITQIQFASGVYNDVIALNNAQNNPYLYLHLGGGNIFVDTYEHAVIFNNYTTMGALIYDPFLGLNSTKFFLDYYRQDVLTERPNVGGYFLSTNFNQGGNLVRNPEASVTDLRYAYDTYSVPETLPTVQRARALLDYPGAVSYLQDINLSSKSQWLFWKGMLKTKGSMNAITAFINSRLFVNANVDQFWAYQVAEFGSSAEQNYFSLLLQTQDTQTNELRLEFISNDEICMPGYAVETFGDENCGYANPENGLLVEANVDPTFTPILSSDQTRWYNQPDQLAKLQPDGGVLYFNLETKQKLVVYPVTVGTSTFSPYNQNVTDPSSPLFIGNLTNETAVIAFDPTNNQLEPAQQNPYTFWYWTTNNGGYWVYGGGWDPSQGQLPTLRHNFMADEVQTTLSWYTSGFTTSYSIPSSPATTQLNINPYLPLTNSLQVFEEGVELESGVDYVESLTLSPGSTVLGFQLFFQESISGSTIKVVYGPSLLNPELQVQTVNTNIIQLLSQEIVTHMFANNVTLTLWGLETNKEAQNPAKIIDEQAEVVLSPVSFWDPARGYQYYQSLHSIDIQTNTDPAIYSASNGWMNQEAGKTWLDTTNVVYVPYYDPYVITNQDTRLAAWGQLTAYGNPRLFEWVASPVAPTDYNALAAAQENDSSIDPSIRLSGTARTDVRFVTRASTTITVSGGQIFVASSTGFFIGQTVLFSSTGNLPTGLTSGTAYTIASLSGNIITLTGVTLTDAGTGTLTMVPSVWPTNWTIDQQVMCNLDPLVDAVSSTLNADNTTTYTFNLANCMDPTQGYAIPLFVAGNTVNIYLDGAFNQTYTLTQGQDPWAISLTMAQASRLTVILPIHQPTAAELAFNPAVSDDGSVTTWWQVLTNYNVVQTINQATNQEQFTYYFWVENVSVVPTNSTREPPVNALEDMISPPQPYMFFNKLTPSQVVTNALGQSVTLPDRFVQAIVRGLRGYVDSNNRYVLRFTRDFTLRDNLNFGTSPLQLKDTHQEWLMFRQDQLGNIPRDLWDRITSSMVGYQVVGGVGTPTVRIPSLDRELYDTQNETSTQYGLGSGQAFVNGTLAQATILAYLNNPANNFYPVDLNAFLSTYNFSVATDVIAAMDTIYTTFGFTNVNNMFFSVLQDALTTQHQYAGLMKTSAVSLYGVELLNANGIYDD